VVALLAFFAFTAHAGFSAGHLLGTTLFGLLLIGAYRLVLGWRQGRPDSALSLLVPGGLLLVLVTAAYNAALTGVIASAVIDGIFAVAALAITLAYLPGLTNLTLSTLLILLVGGILASGRIGFSIATLIEYGLALPQSPAGMTVRQRSLIWGSLASSKMQVRLYPRLTMFPLGRVPRESDSPTLASIGNCF